MVGCQAGLGAMTTVGVTILIKDWSLTSHKEKLFKFGARIATHGRCVTFQLAEAAVPEGL